jgi:hypothetical protein
MVKFILCAVVFVFVFVVAWHLGRFLPTDDARHNDTPTGYVEFDHFTDAKGYAAVKEAERITREAVK